jgi:DNA helicase-2/ATP-dependent DNA helicase PcrA
MLLRALTGDEHNNVMLVGDSKQAIYGFTGSSSLWMTMFFVEDY